MDQLDVGTLGALFLSQSPLVNQTIWLSNNVCVGQKYRKNTVFYPGMVVPLFLVKINLVQPGYWKIPAWHFKYSACGAWLACVLLCSGGRHFGLVLRQLPSVSFCFLGESGHFAGCVILNCCVLTHAVVTQLRMFVSLELFLRSFTKISNSWSMSFSLAIHRLVVLYYGGWNRFPFIKREP